MIKKKMKNAHLVDASLCADIRLSPFVKDKARFISDLAEFFAASEPIDVAKIGSILKSAHGKFGETRNIAYFIVDVFGEVLESNENARVIFGVEAGAKLSELGINISGGQESNPLSSGTCHARQTTVCKVYQKATSGYTDVLSETFWDPKTKKRLRAIIAEDNSQPYQLEAFSTSHGLSQAEADVLGLYVSGSTLEQIAKYRGRSIATIKTQFYALLEKCGCSSQSELLQRVSLVARLTLKSKPLATSVTYPHRKKFTLARAAGRSVEVTMSGDPDGDVIVMCSAFFLKGFNPEIEQALFSSGLCVCVVDPPGSGETSAPPNGISVEDCFAKDIEVLLNSIDRKNAVLWGAVTSFPLCLAAARIRPDIIKCIFSHCLSGPPARHRRHLCGFGWISMLRRTVLKKFAILDDFAVNLFFKYIQKVGIIKYLRSVYGHDPESLKKLLEPVNVANYISALEDSVKQGLRLNGKLLRDTLVREWEDDVAQCPVPIYLQIGEKDTAGPCALVQELARDYSEIVSIQIVPNVCSIYYLNKPEVLIQGLNTAVANERRILVCS